MGTTPGTPLGTGQLRALNQPSAIAVAVDERGIPRLIRQRETEVPVAGIHEVWRVDDGWWREESDRVSRLYFELTLENGTHLTLYHDLLRGSWHAQRA